MTAPAHDRSLPLVVRLPSGGLAPDHSEIPDRIRATGLRFVPVVTLHGMFSVRFVWCEPTNHGWLATFRAKSKAVALDVATSDCGIYWCVMNMSTTAGQLVQAQASAGDLTTPYENTLEGR